MQDDLADSASLAATSELYHFFYLSSAQFSQTQQDIDDILATSRRNNAKAGVTGMLLYHEGSFIQYLEGPKSGVTSIRSRIVLDKRHSGLLKMSEGSVDHRLFGDWSMGFRQEVSMPELQSFHFNPETLDKQLPASTPLVVRTLMHKVYETAR